MSGSIMNFSQNEGAWYLECEVDLSAAAAVTAVRGTNFTCTKTGTGIYTFVIKGVQALKMYEVLNRFADLSMGSATAFWAKVVSVVQGGGTTGDDITVVVNTLSNAATPAAADTTAACTLSLQLVLRTVRMGNPF